MPASPQAIAFKDTHVEYAIIDEFDELLEIEEYDHDAGNNAINGLSRLLEAGAFD